MTRDLLVAIQMRSPEMAMLRAAGRERPFALQRGWQPLVDPAPVCAAVVGPDDHQAAVDAVAEREAVARVAEGHRVVERLLVGIPELQRPGPSGVGGLVDPGGIAVADAEHVGGALVHRVDVAEIELVGVGNRRTDPGRAAVFGANHRAAGAARPHDARRHGAQSPQPRGDAGRHRDPGGRLGVEKPGDGQPDEQAGDAARRRITPSAAPRLRLPSDRAASSIVTAV